MQARAAAARQENQLHRQRFSEVWTWWHDQPDGPQREDAARWYTEWTGATRPRRGGLDDGPLAPGIGFANAGEAYERYLQFLSIQYATTYTIASQGAPFPLGN
jgi:hypothetical protein